jgi:hypothetical protein
MSAVTILLGTFILGLIVVIVLFATGTIEMPSRVVNVTESPATQQENDTKITAKITLMNADWVKNADQITYYKGQLTTEAMMKPENATVRAYLEHRIVELELLNNTLQIKILEAEVIAGAAGTEPSLELVEYMTATANDKIEADAEGDVDKTTTEKRQDAEHKKQDAEHKKQDAGKKVDHVIDKDNSGETNKNKKNKGSKRKFAEIKSTMKSKRKAKSLDDANVERSKYGKPPLNKKNVAARKEKQKARLDAKNTKKSQARMARIAWKDETDPTKRQVMKFVLLKTASDAKIQELDIELEQAEIEQDDAILVAAETGVAFIKETIPTEHAALLVDEIATGGDVISATVVVKVVEIESVIEQVELGEEPSAVMGSVDTSFKEPTADELALIDEMTAPEPETTADVIAEYFR